MGRSRKVLGTALGTAALTACALAFAPGALAVDPTTATVTADCGSAGSGDATLTATQDGTAATITLSSSAVKAPIDVGAGSVETELTLTKNGSDTATFKGNSNPAMSAGDDVNSGPLDGTVAAGDVMEAKSVKLVIFGTITVNCEATSPQDPGPFTF
ncbi:hypothetical protein H181DRAFT_03915 [Streptomyces sp. WMMB 714]|uniref:hypothetical protein n=1 Tax=Streptomyces sp. WMMB 714 TaxID=1286822 RepID=UPI0005F82C8C|nr:hypothetical protein [Streptomyces sp. WMMB 714]SCK44359.1 hypothetical protein H181DRAFT_03915 [Streptomyces sp. WMMB 714]